jgi:hypothetical protein
MICRNEIVKDWKPPRPGMVLESSAFSSTALQKNGKTNIINLEMKLTSTYLYFFELRYFRSSQKQLSQH